MRHWLRLESGSSLPFPLYELVCEQKNLTEFECYFSQSFAYCLPLTCFKYFDEFYHPKESNVVDLTYVAMFLCIPQNSSA